MKYILQEAAGGVAAPTVANTTIKDWDAEYQKAKNNIKTAEFMQTYFKEKWGEVKGSKLKSLGVALTNELQAFGFTENTNPFLVFLSQNFLEPDEPLAKVLNINNYAAIHNAYENGSLIKEDLIGKATGLEKCISDLIRKPSFYQQAPGLMLNYLKIARDVVKNKAKLEEVLKGAVEAGAGDANGWKNSMVTELFYTLFSQGTTFTDLSFFLDSEKPKTDFTNILRPLTTLKAAVESILNINFKSKDAVSDNQVVKIVRDSNLSKEELNSLAQLLILRTAEKAGDVAALQGIWASLAGKESIDTSKGINATNRVLTAFGKLLVYDLSMSLLKATILEALVAAVKKG